MSASQINYEPLDGVTASSASAGSGRSSQGGYQRLNDVQVEATVELGKSTITIGQAMSLAPGLVLLLDRKPGDNVDLLMNGKTVARGEVVVVDDSLGIRIAELITPAKTEPRDGIGGDAAAETPSISQQPNSDQLGSPENSAMAVGQT